MDILERIIEHLTSDEVRRFKILSNRFKADEEKKLLVLFDAIRAGGFKEQEEDLVAQLYGSNDARTKNSYYRLRNKLLTNLEKSLLFYHYNYKNAIESYSYIQLAVLLRERGLFREAYHLLKKGEKSAINYDQFNVLEVIYDEMVKLATHYEVDIEGVIERRRANLKKVEWLRANSEVLGIVTQQLMRRNYSRSKKTESVIDTLEQIQKQLEQHADIFHSASGKIMITKTVASILIQKSAYQELANFAQERFQDFEENNLFNQKTHNMRLTLLIWRINSLQKLLRLTEAEASIEALHQDLTKFKRQNYHEFAYFFYASKVINLKLQGKIKSAAKVLKEALNQKEIFQHEVQEVYLLINLADQTFSQEQYSKTADTLKTIMKHKAFAPLDEELRLYVWVFRMVALHEAGEYAIVTSSYKNLRKQFRGLLKDEFYGKVVAFVDILMRLNTAAIKGKKVFLKSALKQFQEEYPASEIGSNQVILYEIYLQAKLEGVSYYELLCAAVAKQSK